MADISITAASFIPSGSASVQDRCLAGATLTRGIPIYYDSATGTYKQLDVSNTSKNTFAGVAMEDVATGQYFSMVTADPSLALGGTIVKGDTIWFSVTGWTKTIGDLSSGWKIYVAGVVNTDGTTVNFRPLAGGIK